MVLIASEVQGIIMFLLVGCNNLESNFILPWSYSEYTDF